MANEFCLMQTFILLLVIAQNSETSLIIHIKLFYWGLKLLLEVKTKIQGFADQRHHQGWENIPRTPYTIRKEGVGRNVEKMWRMFENYKNMWVDYKGLNRTVLCILIMLLKDNMNRSLTESNGCGDFTFTKHKAWSVWQVYRVNRGRNR